MRSRLAVALTAGTAVAAAMALWPEVPTISPKHPPASLLYLGEEKFLANVRQLTFGGQNAEAYWSADGKRIIFQSVDEGASPAIRSSR